MGNSGSSHDNKKRLGNGGSSHDNKKRLGNGGSSHNNKKRLGNGGSSHDNKKSQKVIPRVPSGYAQGLKNKESWVTLYHYEIFQYHVVLLKMVFQYIDQSLIGRKSDMIY